MYSAVAVAPDDAIEALTVQYAKAHETACAATTSYSASSALGVVAGTFQTIVVIYGYDVACDIMQEGIRRANIA